MPFPRYFAKRKPLVHAVSLSVALLAGGAVCLPITAAQAADTTSQGAATKTYHIAAGPLSHALSEFAGAAGVALSFDASQFSGAQTPGLQGEYSVQQGFSSLLAGTRFMAVKQANGDYVLQQQEALMLPALEIRGEVQNATTSLNYLKRSSSAGALGNKAILDTPFSLTVVDEQEIIERGARSIGQIFANDASVYTPTSSFTTDWWGTKIRGLDTQKHYIDGIPMMLHWGGDFPIEAVESVTALKGLSGFMYGFGSPGGALSYRLKRPTQAPATSVNLGYRNPSLLSAHVDTSQNLGNDWGVRLNLATDQGTAYNDSEADRILASVAIDKKFNESLTWFTTLLYEDNTIEAQPFQFYTGAYDVVGSGGVLPDVTYDYDDFNIDNSYYKTKTQLASTGLDWDINERWNLRSQVGFSRKEHESRRSFAYLLNRDGDYQGAAYDFGYATDNLFSQVIAQGHFSTGWVEHELVTGLEFQEERTKGSNEYYWSNDFNGNIYQNQSFLITRTPDFSLQRASIVEQSSAFISDTLIFSDHWQAIVGLRGTDYEMKESGYETREASPTLALIFKPDAQTSIYGSYVEGLEPGTEVDGNFSNVGEVLGATVSKQYEAGIKHVSDSFNYAAALFRIERANQMQVLQPGNVLPDLTQDGLAVYDGIELSGAYQFTSDLNVGISLVYLDAEIDKTDNAAIKGNAPAGVSDFQSVINAHYFVPGIDGLALHGNVRYFGESYISTANDMKMPSWTTVSAGFGYDFNLADQDMTLYGNINNLLNEKYWASGGSQTNAGEERNLSLAVSMNF